MPRLSAGLVREVGKIKKPAASNTSEVEDVFKKTRDEARKTVTDQLSVRKVSRSCAYMWDNRTVFFFF